MTGATAASRPAARARNAVYRRGRRLHAIREDVCPNSRDRSASGCGNVCPQQCAPNGRVLSIGVSHKVWNGPAVWQNAPGPAHGRARCRCPSFIVGALQTVMSSGEVRVLASDGACPPDRCVSLGS